MSRRDLMKRKALWICNFVCSLVLLIGCSAPPVPPAQENTTEEETLTKQLLSNEATSNYYRTILPYKTSPTRGLVYSRYSKMKNRYDIDTFDLALMRESQSYFNPDELYFQEGQILTKPVVQQLLSKKLTAAELKKELESDPDYVEIGLNPSEDEKMKIDGLEGTPTYIAYLLEKDYLNQDGEIEGITIGLALNPYQVWKNELGYEQTVQLDESELITKGQAIAQELLTTLRGQEGMEEVPMMIGLYIVQEESAVTPGRMVAKTFVSEKSSQIKDWESINERYYLLPDQETLAYDANLSNQFSAFKETIKEYYPHYYGVIGIAHFLNDQLTNLEITVNIQFYGLAEKLSFHQLLAQLIPETFSPEYNINVVVRASDEIYGILQRSSNSDEVTLKLTSWD